MRHHRRRQLRQRVQTPRTLITRRLRALCGLAWLCLFALPAHAQDGLGPIRGFGFDLSLDGGIGVGVQHDLNNNFLGRLRVGALYVTEPMAYALGITGELGGLAGQGFGISAEASHFNGAWGRIGGSRVQHGEWMSQLTLGYLFFGLEWQHRYATSRSVSDAVMVVFRVPIGLWWFLMRDPTPSHSSFPPRSNVSTPATPARIEPASAVPPGDRLLASRLVDEATLAEQQEHWAEAEALLARANRLDPSPLLTLRLARAQRRADHVVSAADSLRRFIAAAVTPQEIEARPAAEQERLEALALVAHLRLRVEPLSDNESVWLDDQPFSVDALGYPYPIDPGTHVIVVKRGDTVLLRQEISAAPGGNVHLKLDPTQAPAPTSQPDEDRGVNAGTGAGQSAE